jgi:hypothetical protein
MVYFVIFFRQNFVTNFTCTSEYSEDTIDEVFKAFPSGHSSFSAYSMVFLTVSITIRIRNLNFCGSIVVHYCLHSSWFINHGSQGRSRIICREWTNYDIISPEIYAVQHLRALLCTEYAVTIRNG